jgi:NADPH:quinone reductase-like Zn-dependent oxidoreductase
MLVSLLPGIEAAGIVEKVDENVKAILMAMRVCSSGRFSLSYYAGQIVCEDLRFFVTISHLGD